jgi:RNA-directed DNA polymerase
LQHALYRAAKADPNRRFHALRDKVYREDVLWRAWIAVRRNNGAPGIDKTTLADVEEYGVTRLLGELADELRAGTWRPLPARKVLIPKPGSAERRPLAIAAVRDPDRAGRRQDRARAGLRGGLPPVQLRVPPEAVGPRCPASPG